MGDFASPALNQPSPTDSERQRIRELSRFYCAVRNHDQQVPPTTPAQHVSSEPLLSSDITLNALAQLAVYRFGANRSFISLIDGENQHIIAETTSSISLRDGHKHEPDDGVYLGVSTLDLAFGVCPDAVKLFTGQPVPALKNSANMTANMTRFIVRDFMLEDHFKDRPYVAKWPFFRFYAEVPIYSPAGYVLGSFCVVDNKPRSHFGNEEVVALQEIADSISRHLENVRTVHFHQRSDRLVHGLKEFVKCRPHFDLSSSAESCTESPPLAALPDLTLRKDSSIMEGLGIGHTSISTELTEDPSPLQSDSKSRDSTDATSVSYVSQRADLSRSSSGTNVEKKPVKEATEDGNISDDDLQRTNPLIVAVTETISVARRIAVIFSQASTLLRESMDLDGVLFLDASRCNSGIVRPKASGDWEPLPRSIDPRFPVGTPPHIHSPPSKDRPCDTLGFAFKNEAEFAQNNTPSGVPESVLQTLVQAFPNGQVFNIKDGPTHVEHVDNNLVRDFEACLVNYFPDAYSVIFLPLWDFDKSQWLSGTFLWTRDRERALGLEELHYFRVFGDSLTSEVARINWSNQEQSKSNFISSLSHELRSPLHGILASAELLSATPLRAEQETFVKMLETCGHTLLDTMNHLLDFAKINNLTTAKTGHQNPQKTSTASLTSAFDLAALVEEVVTTMYLGKLHSSPSRAEPTNNSQRVDSSIEDQRKLSVILRVSQEFNWKVQSVTGAWRRIIMNLLGNALKYTSAGFVEISLAGMANEADPSQPIAHISITDSGCGMSPEFLRHKLFSPFSQEDDLSEGVGLGLSIVQQLVKSLNGSIDVRSEPSSGTQVDIFIPVVSITSNSAAKVEAKAQENTQSTKFCLVGHNAYADLTEPPTGVLSREAKRRLGVQSFFNHITTSQPGWSLSFADGVESASGDVVIVEQSMLAMKTDLESSVFATNPNLKACIVLCDTVAPKTPSLLTTSGHVFYLPQPLCPRLVFDIMKKVSRLQSPPPMMIAVAKPVVTKVDIASNDEQDASQAKSLEVVGASEEVQRVLIVDDNPINVKVLSAFMKKLGWAYDTASNGLIAVNKYQESPSLYRAILMDLSMPVMDGIDATKHIRAFEQRESRTAVAILAITGVASAAMKKQALAAGIDDYMIKPLSLQQLKIALKDVCV